MGQILLLYNTAQFGTMLCKTKLKRKIEYKLDEWSFQDKAPLPNEKILKKVNK